MHFALSQDFLCPYQNNLHLLRHFLASEMYEVGPGTDPFMYVRIIVRKVLSRRRICIGVRRIFGGRKVSLYSNSVWLHQIQASKCNSMFHGQIPSGDSYLGNRVEGMVEGKRC
jgi:hypothetical protein